MNPDEVSVAFPNIRLNLYYMNW